VVGRPAHSRSGVRSYVKHITDPRTTRVNRRRPVPQRTVRVPHELIVRESIAAP
jgi:hypothetical protein